MRQRLRSNGLIEAALAVKERANQQAHAPWQPDKVKAFLVPYAQSGAGPATSRFSRQLDRGRPTSECYPQSISHTPHGTIGDAHWLQELVPVLKDPCVVQLVSPIAVVVAATVSASSHPLPERSPLTGECESSRRNGGGCRVPTEFQSGVVATGAHRNLSATARRNLLLFAREPTPP